MTTIVSFVKGLDEVRKAWWVSGFILQTTYLVSAVLFEPADGSNPSSPILESERGDRTQIIGID